MSNIRKQALDAIETIKATMPEALVPKEIIHADGPSYATLATTRAYLERMSAKVQHNELAPSQATAIAQFASLAIRLAEAQNEADLLALELEASRRGPAGAATIIIEGQPNAS